MAEITLTTKDLSAVSTDVLVLGVDTIDDTPTIVGPTTFDTATLGDINLRALGASAKADSVVRIPAPRGFAARTLAFVGLGDAPYGREEQLRRAAGSATRQITGVDSLVVALPTTEESEVIAVAEGALFGSYTYTVYRSEQPGTTVPASRVEIATRWLGRLLSKGAAEGEGCCAGGSPHPRLGQHASQRFVPCSVR